MSCKQDAASAGALLNEGSMPESKILDTPEMAALMKRVALRVTKRISKGVQPPVQALPIEKEETPKLLCLDTNKWIELARAHNGRDDGRPFKDALAAIREAVANNLLLVPVLPSNLLEVSEPRDEGRRQRLAEFMVDLSGNHSLVNPQPVLKTQLERAVMSLFLGRDPGPFPRDKLVRWGMFAALGKEPQGEPFQIQALHEPENSVLAMVHAVDRDSIKHGRELDQRAADAAKAARTAGLEFGKRRMRELRAIFDSGVTADTLRDVLSSLKVDRITFYKWLAVNLESFADAVPDVDVVNRILLARDRNQDHKTDQNDLKDFVFLKLSIPYGNIIVTEKSWVHLAKQEHLDKKYGSTLLADSRGLREVLHAQGCLASGPER